MTTLTMTPTTARRRRRLPAPPDEWRKSTVRHRIKRAAVTLAAMPQEQHTEWLGLLLADLREAGVDVEMLECALAEVN